MKKPYEKPELEITLFEVSMSLSGGPEDEITDPSIGPVDIPGFFD